MKILKLNFYLSLYLAPAFLFGALAAGLPLSAFATPVNMNQITAAVTQVDSAALPTATDPATYAVRPHIYVSRKNGNNATGERENPQRPFKTIKAALRIAESGDVIEIEPGTYRTASVLLTQSNIVLTRSSSKAGTVRLLPRQPDSEDANEAIGIQISGPVSDVIIDGITIRQFSTAGIVYGDVNTQQRVEIKNVVISGAREGIVNTYPEHSNYLMNGLLLQNVTIQRAGMIGMTCGDEHQPCAQNVLLSNVRVTGTNVSGEDSASDGIALVQTDNVLVHQSRVNRVSADGMDFKATRVSVVNSTVRNVGRNGLKMWHGGEAINTIIDNTGADAAVVFDGGGDYRLVHSVVTRHLFRDGGSAYAMTAGYDDPGAQMTVAIINSIFFKHPGPIYITPAADLTIQNSLFAQFATQNTFLQYGEYYQSAAAINATDFASNVMTDAPQFVNLLKRNLHLRPTSPAIDAGTATGMLPSFDKIGQDRPLGNGYDLGVFEQ